MELKNLSSKILLVIVSSIVILTGIYLTWNLVQEIFLKVTPALGDHHDFLAFYAAAYFILHGMVDKIFDPTAVSSFQLTIIPYKVGAAGYMPYLNPPFVAVFLSPLALLNPDTSRTLWFFLNFFLYLITLIWLTNTLPTKKKIF